MNMDTQHIGIAVLNHGEDVWTWEIQHNYEIHATSHEADRRVFSNAKSALNHAMLQFVNGHEENENKRVTLRRKYVFHFVVFWFYTICAFIAGWFFGAAFGFKALVF